jgi:hypothetical protein
MGRIITLYHGSGSLGFWVEAPILEAENFTIQKGANDWGDDFNVLYRAVSLKEYVRFDELAQSSDGRDAFADIAKTITEIGPFIRFIGVELRRETSRCPYPRPDQSSIGR